MPHTHENQIDTGSTSCSTKELSPPRLSPIKPNNFLIKQEQEPIYESDIVSPFPSHDVTQVIYIISCTKINNLFSFFRRTRTFT